ncbi:MAG: hypothetical protein D6815_02575 [Candidatus Dadabacteria bacterium]|nr:MAG: hypothetical protein D6815_02575 [Candidatus Dadabacteria bacterium]
MDLDRVVDPFETDPNEADSDGDGWLDGAEVEAGTNPLDPTESPRAVCGNGVIEVGEQCDDGNASNGDACLNSCLLAYCGDGYLWRGVEDCDDGAANSDAVEVGCGSGCVYRAACGDANGDGVVTAADAVEVAVAAVGTASACRYSSCDVNGDGRVTVQDAALLLHFTEGAETAAALDCTLKVTVALDSASAVERLIGRVQYAAAGSSFVGEGALVDCKSAGPDVALAAFRNDPAVHSLTADVTFSVPVVGPADLFLCRFVHDRPVEDPVAPEDFRFTLVSAEAAGERPIRLNIHF